jgi:GNAT superfamily N-acetyltransferase
VPQWLGMSISEVSETHSEDITTYPRKDNTFRNAFAISRVETLNDESTMYIRTRDSGQICGYLSVLTAPQATDVWARGESAADVNRLLDFFANEIWATRKTGILFINTDPQYSAAVTNWFPGAAVNLQDIMLVERPGYRQPTHPATVTRLGPDNAYEYANLVTPEGLDISSEILERNRTFLTTHTAFGGFENGKLVSVANAIVALPEVWVVSGVMTHSHYRKKGYATAVTSAVIEEALRHAGMVTLYVNQDNLEAIRLYSKLGYRKIAESMCAGVD